MARLSFDQSDQMLGDMTYYGSEGGLGYDQSPTPDVSADPGATTGTDVVTDYTVPAGTTGAYGEEEAGPVAGPDLVGPGDIGGGTYSFAGLGGAALGALASTFGVSVGGKSGVNLGVTTGDNTIMPVPSANASRTAAILAQVAKNIGKHISAKAIVRFIIKWGAAAAAGATGLGAADLLYLFFREKSKPQRRRGPHLYTVVKRIRAGHRYEKMLSRYSRKAHVHAGRARARVTCMFCRRSPCSCRKRRHG